MKCASKKKQIIVHFAKIWGWPMCWPKKKSKINKNYTVEWVEMIMNHEDSL